MGEIRWHKRDHEAALQGMFELTLEERGAYNTVLDLIYTRANELPDDDRFIAGWLRCDIRVWRRIKARLIDLGKLWIEDGLIRNGRADREVLDALSRVVSAREAGRASGRSRAPKLALVPKENNDLARTAVGTPVERTLELITVTDKKKEKKETIVSQKEKGSLGSRLPADWAIPPEWVEWARVEMGWSRTAIMDEAAVFADYWHGLAGAKARKVDWLATWRNWCRNSKRTKPRQVSIPL